MECLDNKYHRAEEGLHICFLDEIERNGISHDDKDLQATE